jgi:phosphoenolpyruvate carboxylase
VRDKIFKLIEDECALTAEMVQRVTGDRELTERFKEYQARLSHRLPVINEVNREQVELLRRFRSAQDEAEKEAVKVPLLISISCIAAGLGATG